MRFRLLIMLAGTAAFGVAQSGPVVRIDDGAVRGLVTQDGAVNEFKGIPFAAPPVGQLRWREPQPAVKWDGVRPATEFSHHCMQLPVFGDMVFPDKGESEDCLYLNVWAPAQAKDLPVMVWIYGGGFVAGAASEPRQNGAHLAHDGVVVVSMNYRLGILGFMTHPQLTLESPHHASGNYGLMDQAAALGWVKRNIAAFGGDPNNVTIFGESAGSFSVSALMASPVSRDMINKAIGESGASFRSTGLNFPPRRDREAKDSAMVAALGSDLTALRAATAEQLLAVQKKDQNIVRFAPVIDGYFLTEPVPDTYAAGHQSHVPLLAGYNHDEGGPERLEVTAENFKMRMTQALGSDASGFFQVFPAGTDAEARSSARDLAGAEFIALSTWEWIEAQQKTGGHAVYHYRFDEIPPVKPMRGAFHSAEIPYVFMDLDGVEGNWRAEDKKLSEQMAAYWTNFAKRGDPNGPGLPQWPQYSVNSQVLHLATPIRVTPDTELAKFEYLATHTIPPMGRLAAGARQTH